MVKLKKTFERKKFNKESLAIYATILVLVFLVYISLPREQKKEVLSFQNCVDQGYAVQESYPRQCRTSQGELFVEELTLEESCKNLYGGNWLPEQKECENINEEQCVFLGGEFNECASACRHYPSGGVCIAVCVPVCKL